MLHPRNGTSTHPTLHQQLQINRTGGVAVKTILVRMLQVIQSKMVPAPRIATVEKRTMWSRDRHRQLTGFGSIVFIGRIR